MSIKVKQGLRGASNVGNVIYGKDGVIFYPSVDEEGNLSWTNDGELENPKTVNIKGPQGDKGDQGVQGVQGPKGDAFVYSDFTEEQLATLKGEQGPKGEPGIQGPQGPKGDQGDRGLQGVQGAQGPKGETGEQGERGPKGDKGDQGIQGPQGKTGPQGEHGEPGAPGKDGEPGAPGKDGKSAYAYAQEAGYAGTEEEFAEKLAAPSGGGTASEVPDEEMLELLMDMDVIQPLSNANNSVFTDTNNKVYVL